VPQADIAAPTEIALRTRIMDAAAVLFSEHGFDAVSMRDICEAACASKGAVYHHFTSKDELLAAIIITALSALVVHIEVSIEGCPVGAERLRRFIISQAEFFEQNVPQFRVATARFAAIGDAAAKQQIRALRGRYVKILRGIIVDGVMARQFADVDILAATRMVLAIIYWLGRWFKPGGSLRAADVAAKHADIMLTGVQISGSVVCR
jgi:AcrR family transcriptional regulator